MLRPILAADAALTARLRRAGATAPSFWHFMAAKGIGGFTLAAAGVVAMNNVPIERLLLPLMAVYITINIAQRLIRRPRPDSQKSTKERYKMWWRTYSFPSGHATFSACITTLLATVPQYPEPHTATLVAVALGALAALIALSRVMVGVHYVSDVVAGLCIGILAGQWPNG
jgi:undecaprenyl-diphosphatase